MANSAYQADAFADVGSHTLFGYRLYRHDEPPLADFGVRESTHASTIMILHQAEPRSDPHHTESADEMPSLVRSKRNQGFDAEDIAWGKEKLNGAHVRQGQRKRSARARPLVQISYYWRTKVKWRETVYASLLVMSLLLSAACGRPTTSRMVPNSAKAGDLTLRSCSYETNTGRHAADCGTLVMVSKSIDV